VRATWIAQIEPFEISYRIIITAQFQKKLWQRTQQRSSHGCRSVDGPFREFLSLNLAPEILCCAGAAGIQ